MKILKRFLVLIALVVLGACNEDKVTLSSEFRMPAEFEPHESIWLGWATYENKVGWSSEELQTEIIKALIPEVMIDLCAYDESEVDYIKSYLLSHGVSQSDMNAYIRFHIIPHNDLWFRDMGGIFVKNELGELAMVDFNFNTWGFGYLANHDLAADGWEKVDEGVDRDIAVELDIPVIHSDMIMEGGALDFNGKGTMILTEDVFFQRNPTWTKAQGEAEFKRVFNVEKVIWLKGYVGTDTHPEEGFYEVMLNGSLTPVYSTLAVGGHVDEFVRFVDENTILLVEEPTDAEAASNPIIAQTKAAIQQTRQILESSTDQDGNSFTIVDLPDAHPMYAELQEGDGVFDYYTLFDYESIGYDNIDPSQTMWVYFASGYMNFLVTNNVVIIPKYGDYDPSQATKDAEAKAVLEQVFPGRQVIQLDVRAINVGGGGIHCITQQMPATAVPSN